jgi:hypothetical protein
VDQENTRQAERPDLADLSRQACYEIRTNRGNRAAVGKPGAVFGERTEGAGRRI